MKPLLLPLTLALLANASCVPHDEEVLQTTVVQGKVINQYTAQPVSGVPIIVRRVTSGGFLSPGSGSLDSITGARTDAAGRYSLSFGAKKTGTYEVTLARFDEYYDLDHGYEGRFEPKMGVTNQLNFKVIPYKLVTVNAHTNKGGKSSIFFSYGGTTIAVGGPIFSDTARTNQDIAFTRIIKVVPNHDYVFEKAIYNRVRLPNGNYQVRDWTYVTRIRQVGYNDTTVVNLN
jgi:hypothetical protein